VECDIKFQWTHFIQDNWNAITNYLQGSTTPALIKQQHKAKKGLIGKQMSYTKITATASTSFNPNE